MTDTFGTRLRRERERQNISLADIAARTKIKASLFDELERDDVSHWPAGIFRRAFIRSYAAALGLDGDATVREFLERFPDPASSDPALTPPAVAAPIATASAAPAVAPSSAAPPSSAAAVAPHGPGLRLTLAETAFPFTGGRFLVDARRRWSAAAWDLGSLLAIAVSIFVFMNAFWMPFGVTALCYYVGGILFLGNSPGVCLFAPKPSEPTDNESRPSRVPRHRTADPAAVRTAEASAFRTTRYRSDRRREVHG